MAGWFRGKKSLQLPLVSRNYTQIVSLQPGVVANASTASGIGNGTVDVSANGMKANQNNYSMDGASVVNYVSGMAGQTGSFPGIAIPNPDAIQEFKVQTSQYDASSGRNPGANVDVVTKTGTNQYHGAIWEFNRNNFFNGNDFFYKRSEAEQGTANTPQTLKQNTYGFTIGGPIKKDKIFFFGSYQGLRQLNGIGTSGFASGYQSNVRLLPYNDYADVANGTCSDLRCTNNVPAYKAYLAKAFVGQSGFIPFAGFDGTFTPILPCTDPTCNSTNITNTAVAMLQLPGAVKGGYNNGFYFPSTGPDSLCGVGIPATGGNPAVPAGSAGVCPAVAISDPVYAREDQYLINSQYLITPKHTLFERYMYQKDPQYQPFNCFILPGNCNPGAPVDALYDNNVASLELAIGSNPQLHQSGARFVSP